MASRISKRKFFTQSDQNDLYSIYSTRLNRIEINVVKLRETFWTQAVKIVKRFERHAMHSAQIT